MQQYPKIVQPAGSNMCGAYSLVGALSALGCFDSFEPVVLNKLDLKSLTFTEKLIRIQQNHSLDTIAKLVYEVTGIIPEGAEHTFANVSNGLNSIVAMAYVAKQFGFSTSVIVKDMDTFQTLSSLYPQELMLAEAQNLQIELGLSKQGSSTVLLPTIIHNTGEKHSVALSNQGLFDPADGSVSQVPPLSAWGNWIGVALKVEKFA
ncbi:hypothetical protein [Vibrio scophthalmi]|uniref:Peptidase C39 domain-containing protein n=1 Tax=Vibrio scophthalmi LMG 19158 TaxID=870967 RepID=F9RJ06_9VIBR|nr:hypothetical protein [Vibrio scophthalmi]EGU41591.1 hypothetical protein VIS19158_07485 [Vibrio scophthalmi LMG 19158]